MAPRQLNYRTQRYALDVAVDALATLLIVVSLVAAVALPKATADSRPTGGSREIAAQGQLFTYQFRHIHFFADGTQHEEPFTTVAQSDDQAYAFSSNRQAVRNQAFEAQGRRVTRSSGILTDKRPLKPPGPYRQTFSAPAVKWDAVGEDGMEPRRLAMAASQPVTAAIVPIKVCFYERDLQYAGSSIYYDPTSAAKAIRNWVENGGTVREVGENDDCPRLKW